MRLVLIATSAVLLAIVAYYGVVFDDPLPDHPILRGKNDLFLHFCAFAALAVPVCLLWRGIFPLVTLAAVAAAIEGVQVFQAGRTAALDDFIAGLIGILIGAGFAMILRRSIGARTTNLKE